MKSRISGYFDVATEYAIYGVIFSIPISTSMIGIFAGMAIIFFLAKNILSPDIGSIRSNKVFFLLILSFFVFMSLSLFNSGPLFAKSLRALLIKWGRFPLLLWVIIDTFRDTKRLVRAAHVFIFSAALVGITVLTQKFLGFDFLRGRASLGYLLPSIGPFKNQNSLAAYLTGTIPIILAFGLWERNKSIAKIAVLAVTGLLILSSIWTTSRGGLLGLIEGLVLMTLLLNYSRIKKVFWPVFLSTYILFMPLIATALVLFPGKSGSNDERLAIMQSAWAMIKDHPLLGKGIGTFMDYCVIYTNNAGSTYAHNCYVQIWAESGIFSLISFILLAGYVLYNSIKACLRVSESPDLFILTGLTAGLLGYLVHSFFEVNLYSFQLSFLFWVVLGLTVALTQKMRTPAA